ncbi:MAG: hypothetical protein IPG95_09190 [Saprospiraceae bacterium]|nr:hypothetical protein [Saprospiraceae bacterium]
MKKYFFATMFIHFTFLGYAETVKGKFRYSDQDPTTGAITFKPIIYSNVEVWSITPGGTWQIETRTTTDVNGEINVLMQWKRARVTYGIRIVAENYACRVNTQRTWSTFFTHPMLNGKEIKKVVRNKNDVLDFSCDFTDLYISQHFNVCCTILKGYEYAAMHREPTETDIVHQVAVSSEIILANSYYSTAAIQLKPENYFEDLLILHEYAHHIEFCVSTFGMIITNHDGCNMDGVFGGLTSLKREEAAWMEGYANFFAQAVNRAFPLEKFVGNSGSLSGYMLEYPHCNASTYQANETELYIAAVLWDLIDDFSPNPNEIYDDIYQNLDEEIFYVFDKELDNGAWPTFSRFLNAWNGRGYANINKIICQNNQMLFTNSVFRKLSGKASFRQLSNTLFEVQVDAYDECEDLVMVDVYDESNSFISKSSTKFTINTNCSTTKKNKKKIIQTGNKPIEITIPCETITCSKASYKFVLQKVGYLNGVTYIKISKDSCK